MTPTVIESYPCADGQLVIGGVPVERLAARVGGTPFFAYDRGRVTERVRAVRAALPGAVRLRYAVKANPMPALVQHLSTLLDGFDIASAGELRVALDTPVSPERVSFAGPGKSAAELSAAVAAGVTVELESAGELERVAFTGCSLGIRPRVAVRVNPDFQVHGSGIRLGGGAQQFGIDAEQVPLVLSAIADADLEFEGFHVFPGTQNLRCAEICSAQNQTVEMISRFLDAVPSPIRYLNLGGGFGIPYARRDEPLELTPVGENLAALLDGPVRARMPEATAVVELGRYLVGEAGVYVTRILDRKVSRGEVFLVVDGGMHHQMAASGNFGQVIRRNYPVAVANRMDQESTEQVSVAGCLCTSHDLLARQAALAPARVGDLVAVFQAGAYGLTASPTAFLSHPAPLEVLV